MKREPTAATMFATTPQFMNIPLFEPMNGTIAPADMHHDGYPQHGQLQTHLAPRYHFEDLTIKAEPNAADMMMDDC